MCKFNVLIFLILFYTNDQVNSTAPLDPLSSDELNIIVKIIKENGGGNPVGWMFSTVILQEPPKEAVKNFYKESLEYNSIPRRAIVVAWKNTTWEHNEFIVNLAKQNIEKQRVLDSEDVTPITDGKDSLASTIAKSDSEVLRRCAELGYTNMSTVSASIWAIGYIGDQPQFKGRSLAQALFFGVNNESDNEYAKPFPFMAIVDLKLEKVIEIRNLPTHNDGNTKNQNGVHVSNIEGNFDQDRRKEVLREQQASPIPISPTNAIQVDGYSIHWEKLKMSIGFNQREGLVLYRVCYDDKTNIRQIAYRMSLSEMFVPYGDPRFPYHMKTVFDEGEYGMGRNTRQLYENEDCPSGSLYWDGYMVNDVGVPGITKNVICAYVEDAGVLWKHVDEISSKTTIARSNRLVIHTAPRLGNYEYLMYWYFYQDGSIRFEVKLTGIVMTTPVADGAKPSYGLLLNSNVLAPFHQHLLCMRLDLDIDGENNSVDTVDMVAMPDGVGSAQNPYGLGILANHTLLSTAGEGRSNISAENGRVWRIFNPAKSALHNNLLDDFPTSYVLKPSQSPQLILKTGSPIRKWAGFCTNDFWVTAYNQSQLHAGGQYLNGDDLPSWVEHDPNASIIDTDIVIWHKFGITHNPRLEDWPLMPTESTGFWLKPVNFFKENPSLDVPNIHNNALSDEL